MASSQSSERPLGNVAAAVSEARSLSVSFLPSSPRLLHPPIARRSLPADFRIEHRERPWRAGRSEQWSSAPSLRHIKLPSLDMEIEDALAHTKELSRSPEPTCPPSSYPHRHSASPGVSEMPHGSILSLFQRELDITATRMALNGKTPHQPLTNTTLTDQQNHHMRSSPPIQPGEQIFPAKLPSFSEVCFCPKLALATLLTIVVPPHHQSNHTTADSVSP